MSNLTDLPNIGKAVGDQLEAVGIHSPEDLAAAGSKDAWLRILAIDDSACINRLYALEGAIRGIKKSQLPSECKAELKEFYTQVKNGK